MTGPNRSAPRLNTHMLLDAEYTLERFAIFAIGGTAVLCAAAVALYRAVKRRRRGGTGG